MVEKLIMKVRRSAHFKLVTIPTTHPIDEGDYVEISKVDNKEVKENEQDR